MIHIFRNSYEVNMLPIDKYIELSWFRFESYSFNIWKKKIKINFNKFLLKFKINSKKKLKKLNLVWRKNYRYIILYIYNLKCSFFYNILDNESLDLFNEILDNNNNIFEKNLIVIHPLILKQINKFVNNLNLIQTSLNISKKKSKKQKKILKLLYLQILKKKKFFKLLCLYNGKKMNILNYKYLNIYLSFIKFLDKNFIILYLTEFVFFVDFLLNLIIMNEFIFFIYLYVFYLEINFELTEYIYYFSLLKNKDLYHNYFVNVSNIFNNIKYTKLSLSLSFFKFYKNPYINIYNFIESKLELFCIIIFCELMFLCFAFIFFLYGTFDNFFNKFLNIIKIKSLELFILLEYMLINTLKKQYYLNNLLLNNLIKKFLTDKNFVINYLYKYYNTHISQLIKSLYLHNFLILIKHLMSLFEMNNTLNLINNQSNLIIERVEIFKNYKIHYNYNINKLTNIQYFVDFIFKTLNWVFLVLIDRYKYHDKLQPVKTFEDLSLVKPVPFKKKLSMSDLGIYVASKTRRGRPRKLTIFQTESLIQEGILEPIKPLTKKQEYEIEHGVSWDFAQKNPEYMKKVEDYVIRRELRREQRFSKLKETEPKRARGRPGKNITLKNSSTSINSVLNLNTNNINKQKKTVSKLKLYYLHNNKVLEISGLGLLVHNFNLTLFCKIQNKLLNLKRLPTFKSLKHLMFFRIYRSGYYYKKTKKKIIKNYMKL